MANNELYLDQRLQEKSIRDGKLQAESLTNHLSGLTDVSDNLTEFDEEGNPTNEIERELKTLEMKATEAEIYKPVEVIDELSLAGLDI